MAEPKLYPHIGGPGQYSEEEPTLGKTVSAPKQPASNKQQTEKQYEEEAYSAGAEDMQADHLGNATLKESDIE